ncbi:catalase [Sphingomonas kyeonggiensis]
MRTKPLRSLKRKASSVRFSTVAVAAGFIDTPRDMRGYAVKSYTQEGS